MTSPVDASGSGASWERVVIDAARLHGWRVHLVPDWMYRAAFASMKQRRRSKVWGDRGFPDLVLGHEERGVILVELKVGGGNDLRKEQRWWRDVLVRAGLPWRVWRPEQFEDEIVPILAGEREP